MSSEAKRVPAVFYRTAEDGREPVREWLKELDKKSRGLIGEDIMTIEFGWPVGMPVCRPLGGGLFEVRTDLPRGQIARVIFCFHKRCMVLLHGFIKKTQQTPQSALDLATERRRAFLRGEAKPKWT